MRVPTIKINPVAGSKPYVIGIIKAIAVIGPSPGSIPMIVPKKQPTITINMFWKVRAVVNPINIPSIIPSLQLIVKMDLLNKY